ncbi:MAG: undecaprenyl/decaprenyl-phosphate alpha-N-acetylglucosaminyl 1-phosphate transferase [Caldilineales bacterium]|nr:undecaprenyl/decaprenyl-phosphate alpha-N-acetylglucosaminyl 1-phosphate transferase [Caldilineales bacterium]MDW8318829.1 MraY family glycosyltransferase [Anaerolineae bacterium]
MTTLPPLELLFLGVLAGAFVATFSLSPLAAQLGRRWGLVDRPGGRRRHRGEIPRTGGIALYAGFVLTVLATLALPREALGAPDPKETTRLAGLLAGSTVAFAAGLVDDRRELSWRGQILAQLACAAVAIASLIFIERVNNPFTDAQIVFPDAVVWALTTFWFLGAMNTVNWLDGLDGLAAGVTAILCAVLVVHMLWRVEPAQVSVALLPLALLGATLGFLPWNFYPARLFMGSSGSFFLGFAVAALGIIGGARVATVLLVLGLPIVDVAWLIWRRWRRGVSPGQGGRDHLHFRLLDRGFSQRQIVLGYYVFCAAFGALALGIGPRIYKAVALAVLVLLVLAVLAWAERGQRDDAP